jgi:hypothetical protein
MAETATTLSRREATLRSAATTCLTGIALVQAIDLPLVLVQGWQFAVLSIAAIALCVGLGLALAAGPADGARRLWRRAAGAAVLVLAGWAVPRAVTVPGLAHHEGHWNAGSGAACAALAAACLVLAVVAAPVSLRRSARGLATALVVLVALAPGAGALLVALGPGLSGGEISLAAGVHFHAHAGLEEAQIRFEPIAGGRGGHYVYRTDAPAQQTAVGVALVVAAAFVFLYGAVGCLRHRCVPPDPIAEPAVGSAPA